jgi:ribosome-binding protein aMBF1 (putative translation factor)
MPDRKPEALPPETEQKENTMQLSPETRSILRQYKTLINERRRESGLSPVTTAKVLDEICESATRQCAVYLCGHFILQGGQGDGK